MSRGVWKIALSCLLALPVVAGCNNGSQAQAEPPLPEGVPRSQKVAVEAPPDPNSQAAGGSGMPIPGSGSSSPVVLKDAPPDTTGAASGGSGMPIPTGR